MVGSALGSRPGLHLRPMLVPELHDAHDIQGFSKVSRPPHVPPQLPFRPLSLRHLWSLRQRRKRKA